MIFFLANSLGLNTYYFCNLDRILYIFGLCACMLSRLSYVRLFAILWSIACQDLVRGILQARILELVAMPSSKGSSPFRDQIQVSGIQADSLPSEPSGLTF